MAKVKIIYKSGYVQEVKVEKLAVETYFSGGKSVTWEKMEPKPLMLGVDEIAAIFEI